MPNSEVPAGMSLQPVREVLDGEWYPSMDEARKAGPPMQPIHTVDVLLSGNIHRVDFTVEVSI